jgi:riboflavin kinase/FMN adenylyltransferase
MTVRGLAPVPITLDDAAPGRRRVAVGVFDGVHLGHREVMRGADCVLTFDPHPLAVLAPDHAPELLTTLQRRVQLIAALGIPEVIVIPFDAEFAGRTAQRFIDEVLVDALGATDVRVGANFRFGHRGAGDPAMLGADPRFRTRAVPLVSAIGGVVSSTVVRALLAGGDVAAAAQLLGAPFALDVRPLTGRTGETVAPRGCIVPPDGRYAVRVTTPAGAPHATVVDVITAGGRRIVRTAPEDADGRGGGAVRRLEFLRCLTLGRAAASAAA